MSANYQLKEAEQKAILRYLFGVGSESKYSYLTGISDLAIAVLQLEDGEVENAQEKVASLKEYVEHAILSLKNTYAVNPDGSAKDYSKEMVEQQAFGEMGVVTQKKITLSSDEVLSLRKRELLYYINTIADSKDKSKFSITVKDTAARRLLDDAIYNQSLKVSSDNFAGDSTYYNAVKAVLTDENTSDRFTNANLYTVVKTAIRHERLASVIFDYIVVKLIPEFIRNFSLGNLFKKKDAHGMSYDEFVHYNLSTAGSQNRLQEIMGELGSSKPVISTTHISGASDKHLDGGQADSEADYTGTTINSGKKL